MSESVERSTLDLRYEGHRVRDDAAEARLRASIAERGIQEPLEGVDTPRERILLNGFKRYRCATKLGIECVPYVSLGEEEAMGIISLMRTAKQRGLNLLEQARFTVELLTVHDMSTAEVAEDAEGCNDFERALLNDLESVQKYMQRLLVNCHDERLQSRPFHAQANLLTASLLSKFPPFLKTMREFHDRSGQA